MSLLDVAKKTLLELRRNRRALRFMVALPLGVMLLLGIAFGGSGGGALKLGVKDGDAGPAGAQLVERLGGFAQLVPLASAQQARDALRQGDIDAFVEIPANFSAALQAGGPVHVATLTDPGSPASGATAQAVDRAATAFVDQAEGRAPSVVDDQAVITSGALKAFDFLAPGLFVYGVIAFAPQVATALARERETGSLDRVRMSPLPAWQYLGGVALAFALVAALSVSLMVYVSRLVGFHNQGSLVAIVAIALLCLVSVLGIGLVLASFVKTQQEVSSLAVLVTLPLTFLSGVFFRMPAFASVAFAGRAWTPYDLLPTTHAVDALRQVATLGAPLQDVATSLAALAALGALWFGAGVWLYHRARLRAE